MKQQQQLIDYSFVVHQEYQPLEDGSPNSHFNGAVKVSGRTTPMMLLLVLSTNSSEGQFITNINYQVVPEEDD